MVISFKGWDDNNNDNNNNNDNRKTWRKTDYSHQKQY